MIQQQAAMALEEIFAGGGEMGAMMRSLDWSATPLGAVERWPQSLKTTLRIMLTSRQPMFVWWGEQLINLYNDAYKSIVGGKHPQVLGQPASAVWHEIWDQVGPRAESAMLENEGTYDEALLLIMERNGYPEETYYTFSYSPVPNDQGGTGGIICANTDDTDRIIGERQLTLLRELAAKTADARTFEDACTRSAKCLETNPYDLPFAMIYLVDPAQECVSLAGTSGIAPNHPAVPETIAVNSNSLWPLAEAIETHKPYLVDNLQALFGSLPTGAWQRSPNRAVIVPIAPSGHTGKAGILIAGLNPFRLFDDNYSGFIDLVAAQIAASIANAQAYEEERKRAEALAELDRAKTIFFSNISHEFRTPLTLMLGPLEEILANPSGPLPSDRPNLETAHRNSLRLLKLVNALLDFSRIEAGRVQAVYEPTELATLTAELAGMFRSAIERAGMRLQVDCPPLPEPIYVDREMWEKIILNLLSNAFKFTFEGEITVILRWNRDRVELEVRDTGTGIPAEEIPYLFERFHRVEGAKGRTYEGSGIGLSLVQELVKLHGGKIQVSSEINQGSSFLVSIPTGYEHLPSQRINTSRNLESTAINAAIYVEEALRWLPEGAGEQGSRGVGEQRSEGAEKRGSERSPAPLSPSPNARILLADDNADMRDYVKRLLVGQGYEVETVVDGIAALAKIREQLPDLVLTDVMMPGLDGLGLLRSLRADSITREIPIILLSARAGEESRIEGLQAGADDYLIKPFSARELLARVEATLKLAQMRQELAHSEQALRVEAEAARSKISNILESITDAFVAFDRQWRYTYANAQASKLLRKTREELLGKQVWEEVFSERVGSVSYYNLQRALNEQISIVYEEFNPILGIWFEAHAYPSADGISLYFRDISDRKQAEENLRQREAELQLITDTVPALIAYVNHDGRYRFVNRAFTHWFGNPVKEIIGQRVEEFVGETTYQYMRSDIETALAGQSVTKELWMPFRGGVNRYVRRQYIPDIDDRGEVKGFFATISDLTDLKQAEESLRASEERFRVIVNQATVGIVQTDLTGQFVLANQRYCEIVGYPMEELLQKRMQDITHPDDLPHNLELFQRLATEGENFTIEKRYIRKEGSEVWVSNNIAAIRDRTGKPNMVLAIVLDISDRKQAELERELLLQELAIERARFEAVLRQMPAGVMIADAASGKLVLTNKQAKQIVGYNYEQALQLAEYDRIVPFEGFHLDGQPYKPEEYPLMRALQTGETVTNEEIKLHRGDGSCIFMNANSAPIRNSQGKIVAAVVVFQDITERKKTEQALRESERRFRRLVESNMFGVVFGDFVGGIHYANDYFLNAIGYTREELLAGQIHWMHITPPEFLPLDAKAVEELRQKGVATPFEKEYIRKDGSRVPVLIGSALLQEPYDRQQEIVGFVLDLTERKKAEAAWREGKQILDALMEYIPEGITIADAPDVTIRHVSKHGQQLIGRSRQTLEGIPADEHVEKWGIFRADGITQPSAEELPLTRAVKHAEVVTNEEWIIKHPNGDKISILCNAGPIQDLAGKTTGGIIAWRDITERKQAEEILRQTLQKLNFHVENTPMAVIEWDRDFRIIRWSAAAERMLGWKAEEVNGKLLTELRFIYEEDIETVADVCKRLIYSEEPHIFGYNRNYTKNGDVIHCEWYNSSLRDEFGRMTSVLSLVLDVTDRKYAEEERERLLQRERAARAEAEAANRIKDEFLAVLSHELRSPLNPILGWSRLLQTRKFDSAKTTEALATIERNAKLQAELIEDLLDVSRILQGKLSLKVTTVALASTIQAAMETVRLAAEAKSIQMQARFESEVGLVSGDASRLQQVVWNLLSNAIKFTPQGGRVDIRLERIDSYAQITISDTGKGIPVDFLPYVFDYFRQADSTTTRKFGGLGLGLAIVRHLVELHGGTVFADSAGEGHGATFIFRLPLLLSQPEKRQDNTQPDPSLDLQGIEILVVDDEADTRELVAFLLEQYGAQVRAVSSATEAIAALSESLPDLLLSDIGMPDVDGYMLMQQVRSLPPEKGGKIPAIALTAYAGEINYQQAIAAGFQSHLSKPVEPAELVAVVTSLVR